MCSFIKRVSAFFFRLSPYLVLLSGGIWIAWILFNPPLYVVDQGRKITYAMYRDSDIFGEGLYPIPDYITAILHSMGVAVTAATIFYLLKKVVASKTEKK